MHIGVNDASGEIVAQTLTSASVDDASQVNPLLDQVLAPVHTMGADGGYDKRKVFNLLASPKQGGPIRPLLPPRHDAKIEQHGNRKAPPLARDEIIRAIRRQGRRKWKRTSGYHRRSVVETHIGRYKQAIVGARPLCPPDVETHIGRYKQLIGRQLRARCQENQETEARLGCAVLNRMVMIAKLGQPRQATTRANVLNRMVVIAKPVSHPIERGA